MAEGISKIKVGVVKETFPNENRVAIIPETISALTKKGVDVMIEKGAGENSSYQDEQYSSKGATIVDDRQELFENAEVVLFVRGYGANPDTGKADLELMKPGQAIIGMMEPLSEPKLVKELSERGVRAFSMELMPRITRAQSMDVLSSMASIAGYKAVLLAADALPKMFPMMMTAAGTITPAKVFIIGAGVAGLQAIATAKRLGAAVKAYDIRPAVREQVKSLGGDFIELDLETDTAEDKGGYAKEMTDDFYKKQREMMKKVISESDVVITTAAVPGKKAPTLISSDMVLSMNSNSVIVDLAAERGGNCEFTKAGETFRYSGITVIGPLNLPSSVPYHASQMYSKNISTFLMHLIKDGEITLDLKDEITKETLLTKDNEVFNPRVRELLGLPVEEEKKEEEK